MNNDLKHLNIDIQHSQNYEQSLIQLTVFLKSSHSDRKVVKSGLIENQIKSHFKTKDFTKTSASADFTKCKRKNRQRMLPF